MMLTIEQLFALLKSQSDALEEQLGSNWTNDVKSELTTIIEAQHTGRLRLLRSIMRARSELAATE